MRATALVVCATLAGASIATAQRADLAGDSLTPAPTELARLRASPVTADSSVMRILFQPHVHPSVLFQQAPCEDSRIRGRADAGARHGTTGWFLGGVGSGLLLGLIGTGIITAAAATGNPQPHEVPASIDGTCYREGYSGKAKNKNTVSALAGGLVGTAAFILIYVSATSN